MKLKFALFPLAFVITAVVLAPEISAQVSQPGFALVANSADPQADGMIRYGYEIRNTDSRPEILTHVLIDIRAPRTIEPPRMLDTGPGFLFDALADRPSSEYGHAPLGVTGPEGWYYSVYYTGLLSFRGEVFGERIVGGVPPGEVLSGFTLLSPALPAYRPFRVTPHQPLTDADAPAPIRVDSTYILREGYVLAPGWMAGQVTGNYLMEQVDGACFFRALTDCEAYRGRIRRLVLSEEGGNDELYLSHVQALRQMLVLDPALTDASRWVLSSTLEALVNRPPSSRIR